MRKLKLTAGERIIVLAVKGHERDENMSVVIGLTGGIATGKTTVSNMFKENGYPVIDADVIAKSLLVKGSQVYQEIIDTFGEAVLSTDDTINRKKLAKMLFNSDEVRKKINAIIHPKAIEIIHTEIGRYKQLGAPVIIVDIPLLFEAGLEKDMDYTILVFARKKDQVDRLMLRDKITEDYAKQKIKSQFPMSKKRELADFMIDNSKSILETKKSFQRVKDMIEAKVK